MSLKQSSPAPGHEGVDKTCGKAQSGCSASCSSYCPRKPPDGIAGALPLTIRSATVRVPPGAYMVIGVIIVTLRDRLHRDEPTRATRGLLRYVGRGPGKENRHRARRG